MHARAYTSTRHSVNSRAQLLCSFMYLENEELRKEFAALANEVGDYLEQKAAILANIGLQGGSLEVCSKSPLPLLCIYLTCPFFYLKHTLYDSIKYKVCKIFQSSIC